MKKKAFFATEHTENTESKIRNSKHEIRSKHEGSKSKFSKETVSDFEFVSGFDIRNSDLVLSSLCPLWQKTFE